MGTISLVVLVFAFVFGIIAAFWGSIWPRVNFGWLALALLILYFILGAPGVR